MAVALATLLLFLRQLLCLPFVIFEVEDLAFEAASGTPILGGIFVASNWFTRVKTIKNYVNK